MRKLIRDLNAHTAKHPVVYDGDDWVDGQRIDLSRVYYRRVFNRGSFALGGRIFGHFAQQLPRTARNKLSIDGERVVEVDFHAMMLSLLYHVNGTEHADRAGSLRLQRRALPQPGLEQAGHD